MSMIDFKQQWMHGIATLATGNHSSFCQALLNCSNRTEVQSRYFFNGESFYGDDQFKNPTYLDYYVEINSLGEGKISKILKS